MSDDPKDELKHKFEMFKSLCTYVRTYRGLCRPVDRVMQGLCCLCLQVIVLLCTLLQVLVYLYNPGQLGMRKTCVLPKTEVVVTVEPLLKDISLFLRSQLCKINL